MRVIVTKVSIVTSDDGAKCDEACRFISEDAHDRLCCDAFNVEIDNMERCPQCFAREDVTYQIVGE